jgi:hypothetical protein
MEQHNGERPVGDLVKDATEQAQRLPLLGELDLRELDLLPYQAALIVEGAIFRAVRGLVDRSARTGFARLTGTWPGEPRPEPE